MTSYLRSPLRTYTLQRACRSNVLGNHDYRGDVLAQLSPVLRELDNRWLCMRSFIVDAGIVQSFFVDTTPFIKEYWISTKITIDWREFAPRGEYISNLLKGLDTAWKESTATFLFST